MQSLWGKKEKKNRVEEMGKLMKIGDVCIREGKVRLSKMDDQELFSWAATAAAVPVISLRASHLF